MKIQRLLVILGAVLLAACAAPPAPTSVSTRARVPTSAPTPLPMGAGVTINLAKGEGTIIKNLVNGDEFAIINTGTSMRKGQIMNLAFFGMPQSGQCDDVECFLVPVYRAPNGKGPLQMFVVSLTTPAFTPEQFGLVLQRPAGSDTITIIARQGSWQVIVRSNDPTKLPPLGGQKV